MPHNLFDMTVTERIKNSTDIYKDITAYVEETLFSTPQTYIYFTDKQSVKNYLQENKELINPQLLEPTVEVYVDLVSKGYYVHRDLYRYVRRVMKKKMSVIVDDVIKGYRKKRSPHTAATKAKMSIAAKRRTKHDS